MERNKFYPTCRDYATWNLFLETHKFTKDITSGAHFYINKTRTDKYLSGKNIKLESYKSCQWTRELQILPINEPKSYNSCQWTTELQTYSHELFYKSPLIFKATLSAHDFSVFLHCHHKI